MSAQEDYGDSPRSSVQRRDGRPASTMGVSVTPYRDGPYLLRGPFSLRDQDGNEIANSRRVVALCRCGKSRTRPFCDGTHKLIGFRVPSGLEASTGESEKAHDGN
jgi:CDGSH-type Zn-finger protein